MPPRVSQMHPLLSTSMSTLAQITTISHVNYCGGLPPHFLCPLGVHTPHNMKPLTLASCRPLHLQLRSHTLVQLQWPSAISRPCSSKDGHQFPALTIEKCSLIPLPLFWDHLPRFFLRALTHATLGKTLQYSSHRPTWLVLLIFQFEYSSEKALPNHLN